MTSNFTARDLKNQNMKTILEQAGLKLETGGSQEVSRLEVQT